MKIRSSLWRLGLSVAFTAALLVLLSNTLTNPVAVNTRTYTAEFTDASGLHPDGDVRVRGVRVGKVESVALARRDGAWKESELQRLRLRYPADLESVPRIVVSSPNSAESREFMGERLAGQRQPMLGFRTMAAPPA